MGVSCAGRTLFAARGDAKGIAAFGYAMFDRDGRRIAGDLDTRPPPPGLHDIHFRDPEEGQDAARAMTTILPSGERLVVAIDTEGLERTEETFSELEGRKAVGTRQDVANAVLFLATDSAAFISGTCIRADGASSIDMLKIPVE